MSWPCSRASDQSFPRHELYYTLPRRERGQKKRITGTVSYHQTDVGDQNDRCRNGRSGNRIDTTGRCRSSAEPGSSNAAQSNSGGRHIAARCNTVARTNRHIANGRSNTSAASSIAAAGSNTGSRCRFRCANRHPSLRMTLPARPPASKATIELRFSCGVPFGALVSNYRPQALLKVCEKTVRKVLRCIDWSLRGRVIHLS
jgi:hypothetical protein